MVQTSLAAWLKKSNTSSINSDAPLVRPAQVVELSTTPSQPPRHEQEGEQPLNAHRETYSTRDAEASRAFDVPTNVQLVPITESNIRSYRRLVSLLFPIPYPDAFFRETLEDPVIASISRAALWHFPSGQSNVEDAEPQLVAAIRCRLLASPPGSNNEQTPVLYISTIATLAPFRGHSLATRLLQDVSRTALHNHGVSTVMAHVWEANEEAMGWYKRRGFRVVGRVEGYYRRLAPRSAAWIIRKDPSLHELTRS